MDAAREWAGMGQPQGHRLTGWAGAAGCICMTSQALEPAPAAILTLYLRSKRLIYVICSVMAIGSSLAPDCCEADRRLRCA